MKSATTHAITEPKLSTWTPILAEWRWGSTPAHCTHTHWWKKFPPLQPGGLLFGRGEIQEIDTHTPTHNTFLGAGTLFMLVGAWAKLISNRSTESTAEKRVMLHCLTRERLFVGYKWVQKMGKYISIHLVWFYMYLAVLNSTIWHRKMGRWKRNVKWWIFLQPTIGNPCW